MKVLLNEQELVAMAGLPLLATALYVMAIKPRVNIATGFVGIKPKVSWRALAEWLYVEPHSGIKNSGSPSQNQLRRAAHWLEKAGLVQNQSKGKQLILKCLLASPSYYAQKQLDSKLTAKPTAHERTSVSDNTCDSGSVRPNANSTTSVEADTHNNTRTNTKLYLGENAENECSFLDENIPETNRHWATFFINEIGFNPDTVNTIKTLSLFEHWCKDKISIGLARQIVAIADGTLGRQPDTPAYYQNFVKEWLKNETRHSREVARKPNQSRKDADYNNLEEIVYEKRREPRTATECMWAACESGFEGSDFE